MIEFDDKYNDVLKGYSMLLSVCGSFILNMPQESCIRDVSGSNMFRKIPVRSANANFILAESFLHNINSDKPANYNTISDDFKRLFTKPEAAAPPYESTYSSLNNPDAICETLTITYESYAWHHDLSGKISADHLGFELQFLILMLDKLNELEDGVCRAELTRDIHRFISDHLITWIEKWNNDLQAVAFSDFYKGLGYLTVASIEDILQII